MPLDSVGTPVSWGAFALLVLIMLGLDLGVFHRKAHEVSLRESALFSAIWICLALLFNALIYLWFGRVRALEFATGYLMEKALALDNIFVFVVIFGALRVPARYQHRVLFWGVFGALALRALFISAGGAFLQRFHWAMYVFGAILIFTGIRLLFQREDSLAPTENPLIKLFRRFMPLTDEFEDDKFTVLRAGRRFGTPLLVALIAVEITDVLFAVDSIPAIFGITTDPFIVFTSNIFAILGLRSLYVLLAGVIEKFTYLKVGLSIVLLFIGAKMLLDDVVHVPILASLAAIVGIVAGSIVLSLLRAPKSARSETDDTEDTDAAAAQPSGARGA
jgi:tellurite resistance protein TerC